MKIIEVKSLAIDAVKVIRFARFCDHRGYFTEHYRKMDFKQHPDMPFMKNIEFEQCNESYSKAGTIRGLHFQWNPHMGKLVRPLAGRLVDLALDIRKGSPTLGKIIAYDMPIQRDVDYAEWIWLPPGFAHGVLFPEESMIEYFCSGHYSPGCEAGISPLAQDIDWTLCDPNLKKLCDQIAPSTDLISDKDKNGYSMTDWLADDRSDNFILGQIQ